MRNEELTIYPKKLISFARKLLLTGILVFLNAAIFAIYVWSEKQIDHANDLRHESLLLANELRQTSDDQTRLARIYVVTGNPIHKSYYQDILDIRDGKKPRPDKYHKPYWSILIAEGKLHLSDSKETIPLWDLLQQKKISRDEFLKLQEAKQKSDLLTKTELEAMNLVNPSLPYQEVNRSKARQILHDDKYFQAKAEIMKCIGDFYEMIDTRTLDTVRINEKYALVMRGVFILFGLGLLVMLWKIYLSLRKANNELEQTIADRTKELSTVNEQLQLDIIERKYTEYALRESKEYIELLLDSTAEAIYGIDMDGNCTFCNQAFLRILGYKKSQELIGKNMHNLIHHSYPDGRKMSNEECHIVKSFRKEEGTHIDDEVLWRADGTSFPTEYWSFPIFTNGKISGLVTTFIDITDRKRAEKALLDFKFALDEHSDVTITDKHGNITYANDRFCATSKYSREELIGKNHRIVKSGYHPNEFYHDLWMTIKARKVWKGEIKNRAKDGSFYWVNITIIPFLNSKGEPDQYIAIRTDITENKRNEIELKKAKEQAEDANLAKSDFLASMSHEIRTPLNGVIGFTDLLMRTKLNETQSRYMGIVSKSANSLLDLVNDILDFSKIEAGKLKLNIENVDIIKFKAEEKNIKVNLNISSNVPRIIFADPIRLRQILINLLGNSIKFTKEGVIEIKVEVEPATTTARLYKALSDALSNDLPEVQLLFSVIDTGIGISKENQKKIFEAFSQEDSSTTRKYGGTGLGLTISNKLLALMGTKLELESEKGKGSRFYFSLTAKVEGDKMKKMEQNILTQEDSKVMKKANVSKQVKVLVVDDDEINLFLARSILGLLIPSGNIIEATNGHEAIEKFKKEKPDIIFMDVQMPQMNGYMAAIEIRKIEGEKKIPIIALTAGTVKEEIEKCFQSGMDDYASKPVRR
jgi:PAS domain S-box-containing protein